MIPVESLLYRLDLRLNTLATNDHQQIPLENKLIALNAAMIKLIKQKMDENNVLHLGFDAFKKRYEDLQELIEPFHKHILVPKLVDGQLDKWSVDISSITPKYMFYVDSYAIAHKGVCKGHVIYVNKDLTKHSDITTILANNSINPSFEYQETFCTISSSNYEIYGDGSFQFDSIYLSYLRYPLLIDYPGYFHFNGDASVKQDCEMASYLEDEIADIAVQDLAMSTGNMLAAQSSQARKSENE